MRNFPFINLRRRQRIQDLSDLEIFLVILLLHFLLYLIAFKMLIVTIRVLNKKNIFSLLGRGMGMAMANQLELISAISIF